MTKYILAILMIAISLIPTHTEAQTASQQITMCERLYLPGKVYNRSINAKCDLIWAQLTWQMTHGLSEY